MPCKKFENAKSHKVQAQRKFAQGAYVPPLLPTHLERGTQQQSPSKEERSIVHPNIAAKNLLDIVAFKNVHPHQPRVYLRRLSNKEKTLQNGQPSSPEPEEHIISTRSSTQSSQPETLQKNHSPEKQKKEMIKKNISPALQKETPRGAANQKKLTKRRRSIASLPPQTDIVQRDKTFKALAKRRSSIAVRPMRKRALERQGSSSDWDDETPLIMAKKKKEFNTQTNSKDVVTEKTPVETQSSNISMKRKKKKDNEVNVSPSPETKKIKSKPRKKGDQGKSSEEKRSPIKLTVERTRIVTRSMQDDKNFKSQGKVGKHFIVTRKTVGRPKAVKKRKGKDINKKKKIVSQNSTCSKNDSTTKGTTIANSVEASTSQRVFLDVLPHDSPHVIQLTPENIQDQNKRMMSARLIPKSMATATQDLSVVENEPILGPLLQTLRDKNDDIIDVSDDSCDSVIIKEEIPSPARKQYESASLLHSLDKVAALEAPTYHPTEEEFNDPIALFERIAPFAAKYGICKIVAPPSYNPKCVLDDDINFHVTNQYIGRLYSRWGPAMREMSAIKAYLASQNINYRSPLLDHLELNVPKLHRLVQRNGGLSQVLEMKEWKRVAEEMRIHKASGHQSLDRICMKTLLPYDTLSTQERQQLLAKVEKGWNRKNQKLLEWAINPLHRQKKLLGESDSSEEETEEDANVATALKEAEDCIVKGRSMTLTGFKKVASNAKDILLGRGERTCSETEEEYWRVVLLGTDHVCVNTASIDTGKCGYGFPKTDPKAKHAWNLKMVSQNSGNVLRSLGMVLGATVPTLHLGMVFSTSCWHRDPHGLPWLEYMHTGPPKIWYGIPDAQSSNFRQAVETLCPTSCQNKSIWLPSDITMIPPELLRSHGVALARVEQKPGEYIMVFPKAYSCSISTGYTVSESVYFATDSWLKDVDTVFQELRESCEPTTFSLEQLLMSLALDARSKVSTLLLVRDTLAGLVAQETCYRNQLQTRGLTVVQESRSNRQRGAAADAWNDQEECEVCRTALYWSKVTLKGRNSAVCLKHGLRLLETPRPRGCDVSEMQLVTMFSLKQLEEAVQSLVARAALS